MSLSHLMNTPICPLETILSHIFSIKDIVKDIFHSFIHKCLLHKIPRVIHKIAGLAGDNQADGLVIFFPSTTKDIASCMRQISTWQPQLAIAKAVWHRYAKNAKARSGF